MEACAASSSLLQHLIRMNTDVARIMFDQLHGLDALYGRLSDAPVRPFLCIQAHSGGHGMLRGAGVQGGGPVRLTNLLVWGVDLVEEHLLCRCAARRCAPDADHAHQCLNGE